MAFSPNFDFIEELKWRGLLHDVMPETHEQLKAEMTSAYIGFDPTADSLHIGNLVPITLLILFQKAGHKPYVLVGGATGMVGDPSGKSAERNLLDSETLNHNIEGQKAQLMRFLDFENGANKAELVNNYDWFKNFNFLDFIRDVGKHITVSYMMAKDSVKNRMENNGISFTEFSYQLVQGYDFLHLYQNNNCKIQMGGSDQWGNITTGTELIRRMAGGKAFAITSPLVTKTDGTKFGKSEQGNIWLDEHKTSPYHFYQFWLNIADDDAVKFTKIYSLKTKTEIEANILNHKGNEYKRELQQLLASEMTLRVHGQYHLDQAIKASEIFFGGAATDLQNIRINTLNAAFADLETFEIPLTTLEKGIPILDLLTEETSIFTSKGEARKMIQAQGFAINKTKFTDAQASINTSSLLQQTYILMQKGKKNYYVIKAV